MSDTVAEGMWFGLVCNPSNTSFGAAGGKLHQLEQRKTANTIYPAEQDNRPIYARTFESRNTAICAEHGIKSNALEWLVACAMVN